MRTEWRAAHAVIIDTNLYIQALRNAEARQALQAFQRRVIGRLALHGIVAMELRSGAMTRPQQAALADLVGPFRDRDRLIGVSASAYLDAGRLLSTLRREGYFGDTQTPSFVQDVVLAASVRELRGVLVTDNAGDFASIRRHLSGFHFVAPWP